MAEYKRECPDCGKELTYTDAGNFSRAKKNNSVCANCRKMPQSLKDTLSEYWTGKKKPNYVRNPKKEKNYFRDCPQCGKEISYVRLYAYKEAIEKNTLCPKCVIDNRKETTGKHFILTQGQIDLRSARRAGCTSFDEYMDKLPEFKKYKRKVMSITYKQPLNTLKHFEKKGRMGQKGAYNIDHIISIHKGFINDINPEYIGNINNLTMIPWLKNIKKHNN